MSVVTGRVQVKTSVDLYLVKAHVPISLGVRGQGVTGRVPVKIEVHRDVANARIATKIQVFDTNVINARTSIITSVDAPRTSSGRGIFYRRRERY